MQCRKILATLLLVIVTMSLSVPSVFSQSTDSTKTNTNVDIAANTKTAVIVGTTTLTNDAFIAALSDIVGHVKEYNTVKGKTPASIHVINLTAIPDVDDVNYSKTRAQYGNFVQYLQGVVGKVALLKDALTTANVKNTDVVALDVLEDGNVVVFYDPREYVMPEEFSNQDSSSANTSTQNQSTNGQQSTGQQSTDGQQQPIDGQQSTDGQQQQSTDDQQSTDGQQQSTDEQQSSDEQQQSTDDQQSTDGQSHEAQPQDGDNSQQSQ